MENKKNNKKDIIKNLLIIFLIAMLLLTFFSNTIMNRSLPEVSTQYTQYKQINDRIRASATVTANQDYNITADETREIAEVLIHKGDRVERGQVILKLVENESSALSDARQALNQLLIQKAQKLMGTEGTKDDIDYQIEQKREAIKEAKDEIERRKELENKIDNKVDTYEAALEALEAELEAMKDALEAPNDELEELKGKMQRYEATYDSVEEISTELEEAKKTFETENAIYLKAEADYDKIKGQTDELEDKIDALEEKNEELDELIAELNVKKADLEEKLGAQGSANQSVSSLEAAHAKAVSELAAMKREYNFFKEMQSAKSYLDKMNNTPDANDTDKAEAQRLYNEAKALYDDVTGGITRSEGEYLTLIDSLTLAEKIAESNYEDAVSSKKSTSGYQSKIDDYKRDIADKESKKNENTKEIAKLNKQIADIKEELTELLEIKNEAETNKTKAENELESAESKLEYARLRDKADVIEADVKLQNKAIEKKNKEIEKFKSDYAKDDDIDINEDTSTKTLEAQIKQLEHEISELERQKETSKGNLEHTEQIKQLELQNIEAQIAQKQKEISRIEKELVNTEIVSPVSGTVTNVAFSAGEEFKKDETIASVAISEKGFTMEFSATNEQCQRIRIGEQAEIQNYYWGSKPEITVSAFKNDPSNPGRGKIVVLNVVGDDITAGQNLTFTLGDRAKSYDKVVPNSALREDANGKFVFVVESKNTPLGNRYIARRVAVEVIASDETSSALSGELMGGEFIITTSSSPVSDGMQVRLADKN